MLAGQFNSTGSSHFTLDSETSQSDLGATSYDEFPIWRAIHAHFPSDWQFPKDNPPTEETFSWRGCSIHVDTYRNPQSPVRVIMHHGLGTNARMMSMIAGYALSRLGYDVASLDMPYVGATKTPHSNITYEDWIKISNDYIEHSSGWDYRPVVLFGFSVGGMLSYDVSCINHRVSGVCATCLIDLSDPHVRREIAATPWWNTLMEKAGSLLIARGLRFSVPLQTFANCRTISNDPSLNRVLANDPTSLGAKLPLTFLDSMRRHKPTIAPETYNLVPLTLLQAECDRNIPASTNRRYFSRIAGQKQFTQLPSAGHIPLNLDALHLLVSEIDGAIRGARSH